MAGLFASNELGRTKILVNAIGALVSVVRVHPSGRIIPVRGMTLQPLSGGTFIGWDFETPIKQPVSYIAYAYDANDLDTPLDRTTPVSVTWNTEQTWIKDPLEPGRNMPIEVERMPEYTYDSRSGVFEVVNRPDPVVVTEVRSSAKGDLVLHTNDQAERDRFHLLTSPGHVLLLQDSQRSGVGNMYLAVLGLKEQRIADHRDETARRWVLSYVETRAPAGENPSAFVTYADLAALFPSYQAIADSGAHTYLELVESIDSVAPSETITWRGA